MAEAKTPLTLVLK